jgi:hypothetical protein
MLTGCDNGDTNNTPDTVAESVTYISTDTSGNKYTLTVTANTGGADYAGKIGDSYELKIQPSSGSIKISRGTVQSIGINGSLTLKPSNAAITFSITVSAGSMTAISGTITLTDGTTVQVGELTPGGETPEGPEQSYVYMENKRTIYTVTDGSADSVHYEMELTWISYSDETHYEYEYAYTVPYNTVETHDT